MSLPTFVSKQVQQARRYFLDLNADAQSPLALVCGGCERVTPDYLIQRNDFPYYCVELIAEGEGEAILNGTKQPLYPGVVFSYGPRVPHTIRTSPEKPMLKYYIDFTGPTALELLKANGLALGTSIHVTPMEEIVDIFESLQRDASSEHPIAGEICLTLLRLLLLKLQERAIPAAASEPRALATYRRARQLLEQNALVWHSADEAASRCGMTPEYLSRLFKKYAHTTPYRFLMRLKMSRAAELLLDANLKVREVSEELGFSDPFHFSRAFKRLYGASPEQFVRRVQRLSPPCTD
ncbi:MAG: AraC family transcriptional regulator [Verrucomicrobiota bacterium]